MPLRSFVTLWIALGVAAAAAGAPRDVPADTANAYVARLAGLINGYRVQRGVPPLEIADELNAIASEHSATMAREHRMSHDGFARRFERARSPFCVENVGWNYREPDEQFEGWRASPVHDHNMLDPRVSRMGIAIDSTYVTFFACR